MALRVRADDFGAETGVERRARSARTSRLVSRLTGYAVQRNKAVVGANAFAHEAGIHQDGMLKDAATYQIIDPAELGLTMTLPLGKHSGRHAFARACSEARDRAVGATSSARRSHGSSGSPTSARPVVLDDVFEEVTVTMSASSYTVACLGGDGIGPELMAEASRALAEAGRLHGFARRRGARPVRRRGGQPLRRTRFRRRRAPRCSAPTPCWSR